ncbi:MAG: hypothetical protein WKF97_22185 [Chitinophagaceae bacterium]
MIYDYIVTLKNERGKVIDTISVLSAAISAFFFAVEQVKVGFKPAIFGISCLLIVAGLTWNGYSKIKKHTPSGYARILLVAGITWFAMPYLLWIGIPLLLLALLEKQAKFPLEIGFTHERIVMNTLFKRRFIWSEFNNILLKDGMLTLDFKSNKLFQKETIDEEGDAEEDEFNEYCREQMCKCADGQMRS